VPGCIVTMITGTITGTPVHIHACVHCVQIWGQCIPFQFHSQSLLRRFGNVSVTKCQPDNFLPATTSSMQLHYVSVKPFSPNTARVYVPEQTARNLTGGILGEKSFT
jgi:hypothetical protein